MIAGAQINDESWQISVNGLNLKTEGRYIACALVERVRGFGAPQEGSNVIKSTFPLISGNRIITTQIECLDLSDIRVPCKPVDHAWFMKQHEYSNCLAARWLIDTMKELRSMSLLRRMALLEVATAVYTDPFSKKTVTITGNILIGRTVPGDKAFLFNRIVKE